MPKPDLTLGTFANGKGWPAPTISDVAAVANEIRRSPPSPHFDRVTVSRWFPYKAKQDDGSVREVHGVILNGVLLCSQELFDSIQAEAAKSSPDEERARRVRGMLDQILGKR